MRSRTSSMTILMVVLVIGSFTFAVAAEYPEKPIQFLIPFGVGGDTDLSGRLVSQGIENNMKATLVPTNKPGAGGALAYEELRNAKPDGYTLAWITSSILTTANIGNIDFNYNELTPIGRVAMVPMPIAVRDDAPWKTWEEFVSAAKKSPGKYKFGHAGTGSVGHMLAVALTDVSQVKVVMAPVGVQGRVPGILAGKIDLTNGPIGEFQEFVKAGKMRLLLMPSGNRHPMFPDVPTPKELGFNIVFDMMYAVFGPKNLPAPIVGKIQEALHKTDKEFKPWIEYAKSKGHIISFMFGAEFDKWLEKENAFVVDLMKKADLYLKDKKK